MRLTPEQQARFEKFREENAADIDAVWDKLTEIMGEPDEHGRIAFSGMDALDEALSQISLPGEEDNN